MLLAATLEIVLDAAVGHSPLIPRQPEIAGWLSGRAIGERLGLPRVPDRAARASPAPTPCCCAGRPLAPLLSADPGGGWAIVLVGALQLIVFVGPVLISTDVFSYIAYARMGVEHAIDPYTHGPIAIDTTRSTSTSATTGARRDRLRPLYTLLSYPLAAARAEGGAVGVKLVALLASAGTLALTWRCARIRGFDPVVALLVVGANPLWVIYGLGGAHNDLIMTLFMMAAVALARRPGRPGGRLGGRGGRS